MHFAEYKNLLAQAYEIDIPPPTDRELSTYRQFIKAGEEPVLALMCGSGRFLVPLLEEGFCIDGIDASGDMLEVCQRKCAERGLRASLSKQLLQELALSRTYPSIFVSGVGSFGLVVGIEAAAQALRHVRRHLTPGGRLLVVIETPPKQQPRSRSWGERSWDRLDGSVIVARGVVGYDSVTKTERGLGIYQLIVDGNIVVTEFNEWVRRLYDTDEFEELLLGAGFSDIRLADELYRDAADDKEGIVTFCCSAL